MKRDGRRLQQKKFNSLRVGCNAMIFNLEESSNG
jgi:hypothetical protein